jgi:hypothetical protein
MAFNTTLDDIAGEIGFKATITLATWYGGKNLYVPAAPQNGSALAILIGTDQAKCLAAAWGGTTLAVPTMWAYEEARRNRLIASLVAQGMCSTQIGRDIGLSERRVQQIRRVLESTGLLALAGSDEGTPSSTG